ncbi:hypothetical protein B7Y94_05580, partial [Candidatus Saccharibacteria bacterium 32-49-12]
DIDLNKVAAILQRLEFHSLTRRLPKHMQQVSDDDSSITQVAELPKLTERDWPTTAQFDGPVLLAFEEASGDLIMSTQRDWFCRQPARDVDSSIWSALGLVKIVAFDIKQLLHQLAARDVHIKIDEVHDIKQGAFLIDPLRRDRSLLGLTGADFDNIPAMMAGLWRAYDIQVEKFAQSPKLRDIAYELDFPLTKVLFEIEDRGVLIDPTVLAEMSNRLQARHRELEQKMYSMAGEEFNIGSPAQLSKILFEKLQLPTQGIKKGKTGYSTGQAELDKLRNQHPIIELIEQTRELAKLKNTYTDALPKLVDENDRIHTTFNQDVAATGRLSSTQPNLQNIPIRTELGREIRRAFIAAPGKMLVSADYSQFELRLAAVLAGDEVLIADFNRGVDIHTKSASDVYGVAMDQVTKDQRRAAKVINFGVLYGMSPHGLAAATGMSFGEAKTFIDQYFELRAPIRQFINQTLDQARRDGYVETFYGRRRPTPDILSSNFMVRSGAERAAANMPIQGTEADLMKRAMLRIEEQLGDKGQQILQIHDSILVECDEANVESVGQILKRVMESIAPELPIKLDVDVSYGKDWGEL